LSPSLLGCTSPAGLHLPFVQKSSGNSYRPEWDS
jgi:hypothetical protein